jgi:predicted RNA-binding Zn-ribbon protein involved in translation (DUF1610 family)
MSCNYVLPEFNLIVTHQIYICELQKILMAQTCRGLIIEYEGHIDAMKYDKFQSLLMNRHTKCEDVMKKIDAVAEGIKLLCLKCGENPNQEQFYIIYVGSWP